jgi:hypothetical protein
MTFFTKPGKATLKFIWKHKRHQLAQAIWGKKTKLDAS